MPTGNSRATIVHADCVDAMREMDPDSIDAIVSDPPYELGFMGKKWDGTGIAYSLDLWREALRVLKPGGHLVAFGGTRTYHRMVCAIEDAGFEIRDSLHWVYGSGFPKSLDVSKAIDGHLGASREPDEYSPNELNRVYGAKMGGGITTRRGAPATAPATAWSGWGTALKPSHEPIVLARKPLQSTVAANVLAHGTGGINVDGCRVGSTVETWPASRAYRVTFRGAEANIEAGQATGAVPPGRWPPNLLLSHLPECGDECAPGCAVAEMDTQSGATESSDRPRSNTPSGGGDIFKSTQPWTTGGFSDSGGASRFFPCFRYVAKPARAERDDGCRTLKRKTAGEATSRQDGTAGLESPRAGAGRTSGAHNHHPTVKPVELMEWLVRLVTPPGGLVLDPFTGSGTTGIACVTQGFRFVGIEREAEYVELARARIAAAPGHQLTMFEGVG